jgi:predicted alpha/beta-hydrolase family hydrolase
MSCPEFMFNGPDTAELTIALAHGAGAPMDSPFMDVFAERLGDNGFRIARFEFPYMTERRITGKRKPPNRAPVLIDTWNAVIEHFGTERLIVGGKSMGGRMASMVTAERESSGTAPLGLVCLGYPFHPSGKPEKLRVDHLKEITTPTLICQGTRDSLGTREEVSSYDLPSALKIHWLEDGDHGFKPRKKSGLTEDQNWQNSIQAITDFASALV